MQRWKFVERAEHTDWMQTDPKGAWVEYGVAIAEIKAAEERGKKAERERIYAAVEDWDRNDDSRSIIKVVRELCNPSPAPAKKLEMPEQVAHMSGMEYELYDAVCAIIAYLNERGEK